MREVSFANPFFDELSKYPVRFAQPVFFGESPYASYSASLRNGTATLLKLQDRFIAVTCQHVLDGYRRMKTASPGTMCQLGHVPLDPEKHLICEDSDRDLVTFDLSPFVGKVRSLTEANFVQPVSWPPRDVSEEDVLCLAGFPRIWREQIELGYLRFYSFNSGTTQVHSVREEHIVTSMQIQECVAQINGGKSGVLLVA